MTPMHQTIIKKLKTENEKEVSVRVTDSVNSLIHSACLPVAAAPEVGGSETAGCSEVNMPRRSFIFVPVSYTHLHDINASFLNYCLLPHKLRAKRREICPSFSVQLYPK